MERMLVIVVVTALAVLGFFLFQGNAPLNHPEEPLLGLVDYRDLSDAEDSADGVAVVDFNPNSPTFGQILQRVGIGHGVLPHHLYANRDGSKLYTSALGGASLYRIQMDGDRIDSITPLNAQGCVIGEDLYFSEDGSTFHQTCMGSDRVLVFDAHSDALLHDIQAPAADTPYIHYPHGLDADERIDRMIVTETISGDLQDPGSSVSVIEYSSGQVLSTHELIRSQDTPSAPVEVMFHPTRPIAYITAMLDASVWAAIWDEGQQDFSFKLIDDGTSRGQSWPLEMHLFKGTLYVSYAQPGGVNAYSLKDPERPRLLRTYPAEAGAHHIEFSPDGRYLFVQNNLLNLEGMNTGTISVVELESGELIATMDAFNDAGLKPESIMLLDEGSHH